MKNAPMIVTGWVGYQICCVEVDRRGNIERFQWELELDAKTMPFPRPPLLFRSNYALSPFKESNVLRSLAIIHLYLFPLKQIIRFVLFCVADEDSWACHLQLFDSSNLPPIDRRTLHLHVASCSCTTSLQSCHCPQCSSHPEINLPLLDQYFA